MEDISTDASISPTNNSSPVIELQDVQTVSFENVRSSSPSQQTKKSHINQFIV